MAQTREGIEGNESFRSIHSIHGNTGEDEMEYGKGPCLSVFTEVTEQDEENMKSELQLEIPEKDLIEPEVSWKNVHRETKKSQLLLKNPKDSPYGENQAIKWANTSTSLRNKLPSPLPSVDSKRLVAQAYKNVHYLPRAQGQRTPLRSSHNVCPLVINNQVTQFQADYTEDLSDARDSKENRSNSRFYKADQNWRTPGDISKKSHTVFGRFRSIDYNHNFAKRQYFERSLEKFRQTDRNHTPSLNITPDASGRKHGASFDCPRGANPSGAPGQKLLPGVRSIKIKIGDVNLQSRQEGLNEIYFPQKGPSTTVTILLVH
jgi:hypothetical protein